MSGNKVEEASRRVEELRERQQALEAEIHVLKGRIANLDMKEAETLGRENKKLKKRRKRLIQALTSLMSDSLAPRNQDDIATYLDSLAHGSERFFKIHQVEESLWKNIVS